MDLEKARRNKQQRTAHLEEIVNPVVTEEYEDSRSLSERYQSIIDRIAVAVHGNSSERNYPITKSPAVYVMRTEGTLPNILLRFTYTIVENDSRSDSFGFSFTNKYGERIIGATAEWIHLPDAHEGLTEPMYKAISYAEKLQFGEVFAEERVNDPLQKFHMVASPDSFTLVEQSLDIYEQLVENNRFSTGMLGDRSI